MSSTAPAIDVPDAEPIATADPGDPSPWASTIDAVAAALGTDLTGGLDESEAARRLQSHGPNQLRAKRPRSVLRILIDQFRGPVVAILAAAAIASLVLADWLEAGAIGLVLAIDAAIGFTAEWRAVRSMEALRALGRTRVRVRRGDEDRMLDDESLVPGDLIVLEAGDLVAADLRIVEANKLEVDESTLTGESEPVPRSSEPVAAETPVADRRSMLHRGTKVVRGSGRAIVVATGMDTEVGRVADLTETAEDTVTPLERRLERLGHRLLWLVFAIATTTVLIGMLRGRGAIEMIEIGVALAVAAIPEGLPIVATVALARGLWRLARHHALVNRLAAVEVLGATGVIIADKTGTLTENRMEVVRLELADGDVEGEVLAAPLDDGDAVRRLAFEVMALCTNAALPKTGARGSSRPGDPLEVALLTAAATAGIDRPSLIAELPERREEPFDPATRRMATVHGDHPPFRAAVKGAAEAIVPACTLIRHPDGPHPLDDAGRAAWLTKAEALAADGLRVLALATAEIDDPDTTLDHDLMLVGLVALRDPPRRDVAEALDGCRRAGLRVVMATGDHPGTARRIARDLGILLDDDPNAVVEGRQLPKGELDEATRRRLLEASVFARVDPGHKLEIIRLHQRAGEIVAMTGDGVNDAPALRQADIGVAMGHRGTAVAREAADMVLQDDAFDSIVRAIRHGRVIDRNIRRFVRYLLSCNLSEVAVVLGAASLGLPMPILPLQILYLNLVTDVFPALALGVGEGDDDIMTRPPRPAEAPLISRRDWIRIGVQGVTIAIATIVALLTSLGPLALTPEAAVTTSFLTLGLAQVWHVLAMRSRGSHPVRNDVTRNPWVLGSIGLCLVLLALPVHLPVLAGPLGLDAGGPGVAPRVWGVALACSIAPAIIFQIALGCRRRPRPT